MKKWFNLLMIIGIMVLSLFVITAIVGIGYGVNEISSRRAEMADFLMANPNSSAVVAYTVDKNGEMAEDGLSIFRNADRRLVVGSVMKTIVLTAYASAVDRGEVDPAARVPVADWERYYLPGTSGSAHADALASIGLAADKDGFAVDRNAVVKLEELARFMIYYSGNAETDYLIDLLGQPRIEAAMAAAGIKNHDPIRRILGTALLICNVNNPAYLRDELETDLERNAFQEKENRLSALYLGDDAWRQKQLAFLQAGGCTKDPTILSWENQSHASQLFPKGTAREYAALFGKIVSGQLINSRVSKIIQDILETIPADWPVKLLFHDRFGEKDGLTAGTLALAAYAVPRRGAAAGKIRVTVMLFNDLPLELWQRQATWQGIYFLETDLAEGSGVFGKLR